MAQRRLCCRKKSTFRGNDALFGQTLEKGKAWKIAKRMPQSEPRMRHVSPTEFRTFTVGRKWAISEKNKFLGSRNAVVWQMWTFLANESF